MISESEQTSELTMDEATKLYRKTLEDKLIKKFKKEFNEKIGYTPQVITLYDDNSNMPKIELDELIYVINNIMEKKFGDRKINRKLMRITSFLRTRDVSEYRFIYFKIGRLMGYTLNDIGNRLETDERIGYDHTTVIHGIKTFDNLLSTSEEFALKYQHVVDNIRNIYVK